jgi:hypothetical protein
VGAQKSAIVRIPTKSAGNYYIIFRADHGNLVMESNENNNTRSLPISVISRKVDLFIQSVSTESDLQPGTQFGSSVLIKNDGNATTSVSTTFYLSTDTSLDNSDELLGTHLMTEIAAQGAREGKVSLTIPRSATQGTYYLLAVADKDNEVEETEESNNTKVSSVFVSGVVRAIGEEITKAGDISVYPNPSTGRFTVELGDAQSLNTEINIDVIDVSGKIVHQQRAGFFDNKEVVQIPGGMAEGVYFLRVRYGNTVVIKNILLNK